MRTQGGFGSAGAGNRTGRNTMTRGGLATTGKAQRKRSQREVTGTPTREELTESIRLMRCWWCGAESGVDGRPFKSLAGHWRWAHGIDAQLARDILRVPKHTAFIDLDLRDRLSRESKRRYRPDLLRSVKSSSPRLLSAFGVESNRQKIKLAQAVVAEKLKTDAEFSARFKAAVSKSQGGLSMITAECVICGSPFVVKSKNRSRIVTCSKACRAERKRRSAISMWQRRLGR